MYRLCGNTDYPPEDVMWPPWAGQLCGLPGDMGSVSSVRLTWPEMVSSEASDNQAQHAVIRGSQCDNKGKYHSPQNLRGSWCSVCMIRYLKEQKEKTKYWLDVRMYFGPQGSNKFLTFYWVKPKWNKMENLYPVPSESWLGEGSQEKLNENSPHFVVCMKIMFLLVFWDEKNKTNIT